MSVYETVNSMSPSRGIAFYFVIVVASTLLFSAVHVREYGDVA